MMAEMTAKAINDLPDSAFAYIEAGGTKDSEGKTVPRSKRHFAIHDADHVRNALARIAQGAEFGKEAMPKVKTAAKKFGINVADDASRADDLIPWPNTITRAFAIDDAGVRPGRVSCDTCGRDATGRMVDSYAAVFGVETEIIDERGRYMEELDAAAFNRTIDLISRSKAGLRGIGVFYHHGKTLYDTPSEMGSVPLGHDAAIRADGRGLLASTHYSTNDFAERILQGIKDGDINGNSFTGRIIRSDPDRLPRARRGAPLPKVRRLEMGLSEHGPTPLPFYEDAVPVAIRSQYRDDPADPAGAIEHESVSSQADIARRIRVARHLGRLG
jgi:phage head maturation protease